LPTGIQFSAVGINHGRLDFLKYGPGDYFKPHEDSMIIRTDGLRERSILTLQLYLNSGTDSGDEKEGDFVGGATTFLPISSNDPIVPCVPQAGRVLIFQHDILHEGSMLHKGTKYTMRTDIMYRARETK
jgi:hypothetical protein